MKDIEFYRSLFPHLKSDTIYLNHAAIGPFTEKVINRVQQHLVQRSSGFIDNFPDDLEVMQRCRNKIAHLIHAPSPERIAFTSNTSDAINIIAAGLNWQDGDRVLLNDIEFPANVYPYVNQKKYDVQIDYIHHDNGRITPEMIEEAIRPETRVLALSAVQFLSGYKADLKAVGQICKNHDILFIVDGIQAIGAMNIDVKEMHIDALATGAHKWQMAPQGIGFLYLTEELQSKINQKYLGWLSVANPWQLFNYDQELIDTAKRYENGTYNIPGIYGYDAALDLLLEAGISNIERRLNELTQYIVTNFQDDDLVSIFSPEDINERAGIVTLSLPDDIDANVLMEYLKEHHVILAVREGKVRLSPHFYNTIEEIEQAISILKKYLVNYR
ncbi:MAG TPA: aminotransferase class V-fold PLP-dependent enzyme [Balneolales bacterium]|nr:aminotransferase class V-fold PLP-dependent enzyme [Balneolales bacterium]